MKTLAPNSRISWIDMAKGYGTILVILAHLLNGGMLRLWIYTFHMPLFFFLSGYVFSTKNDFKTFVKKKCKSIVIPYFCLGVPMVLYELCTKAQNGVVTIQETLNSFLRLIVQNRLWTLWFIACLFFLNILFYGVAKLCKTDLQIAIASIVMLLVGLLYASIGGPSLPWNVDVCFTTIPFFAVGYLYKRHVEKIDSLLEKRLVAIGVFVVSAILNLVCGMKSIDSTFTGLEMFYSKYGNPVYTYLSAFAGIICMVLISKAITIKPIRYIGENSMLYYAWHQTIWMPVLKGLMTAVGLGQLMYLGVWGNVLYMIIWLLGIIVVSTICDWGIKKAGWKFMLGK